MSAQTRTHSLIPPQEQDGPAPSPPPFSPLNEGVRSSLFPIDRVFHPWLLALQVACWKVFFCRSGQEAGFLPDSWRYRYTRKFTSSLVMLILASPRGDEVFTKQQPPPSVGKGKRRKRRDVSDTACVFLLNRISFGK